MNGSYWRTHIKTTCSVWASSISSDSMRWGCLKTDFVNQINGAIVSFHPPLLLFSADGLRVVYLGVISECQNPEIGKENSLSFYSLLRVWTIPRRPSNQFISMPHWSGCYHMTTLNCCWGDELTQLPVLDSICYLGSYWKLSFSWGRVAGDSFEKNVYGEMYS